MKLNQINLANIKGFTQAKFREVLDAFGELPSHITEQVKWRLAQVKQKSPECYENDKCVHCGCEVSSKVFEDRGCSANTCYPKMMNMIEWYAFKLHTEIDHKAMFGDYKSFNEIYKLDGDNSNETLD